ncbi:DUF2786 domain-containing protein [Nakamurella sp.]|uniref:DUF2786 domain-containing protein n=1 Tax=Nakamurella sp. TaxID=1869182 RepID=UPI003B3B5905
MSDKDLTRIAALLRKAEGTDNEHEADAFLQAAQRLATLASVDLAVARAHTERRERRPVPTQRAVVIGESGKRGLRTYVELFLAIGRANNLTCDIARDSTRVHAFGFDTDIDMTETLYASLVVQMVRASDAYIKSGDYALETVIRRVTVTTPGRAGGWRREDRYVEKPVHATTARINFQQAFAQRIGARLAQAKQETEQRLVAERPGPEGAEAGGAGVALVLRQREVELADHYRAHSTARGTWAGNRATAGRSERSRQAGDRAGRRARLAPEQAIGGRRTALDGG